jgi:RNA-binding protein YlmH
MKRSNHSSSSNGKFVHLNHESFLVAAYDIIELTRKKSGDHLAFDICLMTPSS